MRPPDRLVGRAAGARLPGNERRVPDLVHRLVPGAHLCEVSGYILYIVFSTFITIVQSNACKRQNNNLQIWCPLGVLSLVSCSNTAFHCIFAAYFKETRTGIYSSEHHLRCRVDLKQLGLRTKFLHNAAGGITNFTK